MSDEPSIEVMMLTRFLEAAPPREVLRWHKAELEKVIALARGAEREKCIEALEEHLRVCGDEGKRNGWQVGHQEDIQILKDLPA